MEQPDFLDPKVIARLNRISITARQPMLGSVTGMHKSAARGSSVEFAEYRKYVPGDDIRYIDWRVYGRTDKFFIKEFEADTNLRCYLIMDTSASMGFEAQSGTKFDYARNLAAHLAYVLAQQGDAVGMTTFSDKLVHDIPARRSPLHLRLILDTITKVRPQGQTELVQTIHDLAEKISSRALVVVISDLFTEVDALLDSFQHMRFRKHDLAVFHLLDDQELSFGFDRPIRFQDMESSFSLVTDPSVIKSNYLEAVDTYLKSMQRGCRQFGVDYQRISTDTPFEKILSSFLLERVNRAKKGRRR